MLGPTSAAASTVGSSSVAVSRNSQRIVAPPRGPQAAARGPSPSASHPPSSTSSYYAAALKEGLSPKRKPDTRRSSTPTLRAPTRVTSRQPLDAAAVVGATTSDNSPNVLHSKLQSIMNVRQQIEQLASRHRVEEEALAAAVNQLISRDTTAQLETRQELQALLTERDKAIQMLTVFRKEGGDVIRRLHESLKQSTQQCEEHLRTVSALSQENANLRRQLSTTLERQRDAMLLDFDAMGADATNAGAAHSSATSADADRRCREYATLLSEADQVVISLRHENERLKTAIMASGAGSGAAASEASSNQPATSDVSAALRDQLRAERRQRLEAEEQSHLMLMEQQRRIQILEQRLTVAEAASGGHSSPSANGTTEARTPRTAGRTPRNGVAVAAAPAAQPAEAHQGQPTVVADAQRDAQLNELLDIERQLLEVQRVLGTPRSAAP